MNRPQTNTERPTSNTEHRRAPARAVGCSAFGVRCWMFDVRPPSGSWPRFTSGFWRCSLPMNRWSAPSRSRLDSSPAGTSENSPPFQRWVHEPQQPRSPAGAKESVRPPAPLLPSLTGLVSILVPRPTDESVGYFRVSLRDRFPDRQECANGRPRLPGSWPRFTSGFWRCPLSMNRRLQLRGSEGECGSRSGASWVEPHPSPRPLPVEGIGRALRAVGEPGAIAWAVVAHGPAAAASSADCKPGAGTDALPLPSTGRGPG
jgi:hypothetical protein